jgi:hypothetical protein
VLHSGGGESGQAKLAVLRTAVLPDKPLDATIDTMAQRDPRGIVRCAKPDRPRPEESSLRRYATSSTSVAWNWLTTL